VVKTMILIVVSGSQYPFFELVKPGFHEVQSMAYSDKTKIAIFAGIVIFVDSKLGTSVIAIQIGGMNSFKNPESYFKSAFDLLVF